MPGAVDFLAGVRVVSLEQYISAPYCTEILAEAGAEVIKVERPPRGDPRRSYEPVARLGDDDVSGGFASYNRGKASVVLDISAEAGRASLDDLLSTADVFVSNLRPGVLARHGMTVEQLRARHPRLVVCEISGFGVTGGPYADLAAFDSVIQAMSGLSSLLGDSEDSPPLLAPMSTMDLLTGTWAALGIAFALVRRAVTGQGCHIDAAMYDIGAAFMERALTLHEFTGEVPTRGVDRYSPVGAFRAADDRWVSIVIPTDEMWHRCCTAIGRPDLEGKPGLGTVTDRAQNMQSRIVPALETWARESGFGATAAAQALQRSGQPAGVVQSIDEVRSCAHLAHRAMFAPLLGKVGDSLASTGIALARIPLLVDGIPSAPGPVPALGADDGLLPGTRAQG